MLSRRLFKVVKEVAGVDDEIINLRYSFHGGKIGRRTMLKGQPIRF